MAKVDFPSNSDKSKSDLEKRYKEQLDLKRRPVSTKDVAKKKEPGMIDSLLKSFIQNDVEEVKNSVIRDVIKPSIKRTIFNAITEGARQLLDEDIPRYTGFGNSSIDYRGRSGGSTVVSSSRRSDRSNPVSAARGVRMFDSRDYPFPNRGKAEEVLYILRKDIHDYGKASVAAFLKEAGYSPEFNDYDIGWIDLSEGSCYVRGTLDGYLVILPAPIRISDM